jgi:hypothetical protein
MIFARPAVGDYQWFTLMVISELEMLATDNGSILSELKKSINAARKGIKLLQRQIKRHISNSIQRS